MPGVAVLIADDVLPHVSQMAFLVGALSTAVLVFGGLVTYTAFPALTNVSRFDLLYAIRQPKAATLGNTAENHFVVTVITQPTCEYFFTRLS